MTRAAKHALTWSRRYADFCERRVDGASLSLFRILFGAFLLADAVFFDYNAASEFGAGAVTLHHAGFGWWPIHSVAATRWILRGMAVGGAMVSLGWHTRVGFAVALFGIAQLLLRDASFFFNHLALCLLLCVAGLWMPMSRRYALRPELGPEHTGPGDCTVAWHELACVVAVFWGAYFFGGLSKLRPEWWSGQMIHGLLVTSQHRRVLAEALLRLAPDRFWAVSGLCLDLAAPLGFASRRLRWPTVVAALAFHLINHEIFNIGLFSYLMAAGMVLYFDPAWPEALLRRIRQAPKLEPEAPSARRRYALVSIVLALAALRQYALVPHPDLTREGSWLGWRWHQEVRHSCATRFARDPKDPVGEIPSLEHTPEQNELIDHDVAAIWLEARRRLCPAWGRVYARWACLDESGDGAGWVGERSGPSTSVAATATGGARATITPPPWLERSSYRLDPDTDLCQAGYSLLGRNAWIY